MLLQVGFENIPYFSTVFKKYCGVSPSEWKEKKADPILILKRK
ncbi:MAG: helix-turn-helix domain-containing protein [Lachnospiraceae bacterium]